MSKIDLKVLLLGLALLALVTIALVGMGERLSSPSPPSPHGQGQPAPAAGTPEGAQAQVRVRVQVAEERPTHPKGDIRNCLRCHVRPGPPPLEKISFCTQCHPLEASHSSAPTPAHPVRFEASAGECWLCHSPHRGPKASEHATSGETGAGASLCAGCHLSLDGLASDEGVRDSCAQCHNLGLPPGHPSSEEDGVEGCLRCHEGVMR